MKKQSPLPVANNFLWSTTTFVLPLNKYLLDSRFNWDLREEIGSKYHFFRKIPYVLEVLLIHDVRILYLWEIVVSFVLLHECDNLQFSAIGISSSFRPNEVLFAFSNPADFDLLGEGLGCKASYSDLGKVHLQKVAYFGCCRAISSWAAILDFNGFGHLQTQNIKIFSWYQSSFLEVIDSRSIEWADGWMKSIRRSSGCNCRQWIDSYMLYHHPIQHFTIYYKWTTSKLPTTIFLLLNRDCPVALTTPILKRIFMSRFKTTFHAGSGSQLHPAA